MRRGKERQERRGKAGRTVTAGAASAPICQPGLQSEVSAIFSLDGSMILNGTSSDFAQVVVRPLS